MREDSLRKKQTGMSDSIGPESGLRQTVLRRFHLGTMILLPSHRLKQWGQLGENLGGVRFPERGASRGSVCPPKPGEVVSNTGNADK